jgi:phosphotransferase system enzyme I (PtsI)
MEAVIPEPHRAILAAYIEMVSDEALVGEALLRIERDLISAEAALSRAIDMVRRALAKADDPYLSARAADLDFVEQQLLHRMQGIPTEVPRRPEQPAVVVARHLSPADAVLLQRDQVLALVTDVGGATSHTAIVARSLGIPAVVGLGRLSTMVREGERLIVDGLEGTVVVDPSPALVARYEDRRRNQRDDDDELLPGARAPAVTRDNVAVTVRANVEQRDDVTAALARGAEGIGLLRSEFLYLGRAGLPDEQAHYQAYRDALERAAPYPVTIRTLDLGGDKLPPAFHSSGAAPRAWSLRGIRLSLRQQQIFRWQLRGLVRASAHGELRVLFPMVSGLEEVLQAKEILRAAQAAVQEAGHAAAPHIPVGVMIEVPAAVAIAELLAEHVDFFSIGTNDLIHYALAIDRGDERAAPLYQPLHPGVLRLIRQTLQAAEHANLPVALCGDMARDPACLLVLLGLGLRELSVNAMAIPKVKALLKVLHTGEARALAEQVLACTTAIDAQRTAQDALARLLEGG